MKITERVALIRAGYTKKEIESMIAEEKSIADSIDSENSKSGEEDKDQAEPTKKDIVDTDSASEKPSEISEEMKKLFDDMKKTLADIQAANQKKDIGSSIEEDTSFEDLIHEIVY